MQIVTCHQHQKLFWEKFYVIMVENGMPDLSLKGKHINKPYSSMLIYINILEILFMLFPSTPHVMFIGYDNKRMCKYANTQNLRDTAL
jgi:hypothetical protein